MPKRGTKEHAKFKKMAYEYAAAFQLQDQIDSINDRLKRAGAAMSEKPSLPRLFALPRKKKAKARKRK